MNTDMIAFEAEMKRLRGAYIFDIAPAIEMYRAALDRAEMAESEATDAIITASDAAQREENAMHALSHFRARVAELEAQLAAQQWQPVTEKPEPDQKVEIIIEATFDGYGRKGWTTGGFYFNADFPTGWRPLPPAPQETE